MPATLAINDVPTQVNVTAGMLSQAGLTVASLAAAVDGNTGTVSWHTDTSVPGAYLQVDLGAANARAVRRWRLHVSAPSNAIYDVEFSDDAATWIKAATRFSASVGATWNECNWPDVGTHRYWRLLLTNTPGGGPYVNEMDLWERPPFDVATLGFRLSRPAGWLDLPPRTHPQAVRAALPGAILSGPIYEGTRKLTLDGVIDATTADIARANRDALLLQILRTQPARLVFADQPTRYIDAYLEAKTVGADGPVLINRTLRTVLNFLVLNPYYYDITRTTDILDSSGGGRFRLGTAPSWPVLTISGASTNPAFILYRNDSQLALGQLGLTLSTVAGDTLVIDMAAKTIKKNGVSVLSAITSGDFFSMDPATAQVGLGVNQADRPYIVGGSGSGTTTFHRAWR